MTPNQAVASFVALIMSTHVAPPRTMATAHVTVHLKPGISDPEGANTLKALQLLGFDGVHEVHTTRIFNIHLDADGDEAKEQVDRMCRRLLTNPVIHDYEITLE